MTRSHLWHWALLALLVGAAGCSRAARIEGEYDLTSRTLLAAARRPLAAYAAPSGQQTDLIDAADAMRARLDREGFPTATVTPQPGSPPTFVIVGGPRVVLGTISCTGDLGLPAEQLAATAIAGSAYTSATKATVRARIARLLRGSGYLRAKVDSPVEHWQTNRSRVDLTLAVQAGALYRIVESRIELAPDSDPAGRWTLLEPVLTPLLEQSGMVCLPYTATDTAARLRGRLLDLGHREAQVEIRQRDGSAPGEVLLLYILRPGPLHMIRSLTTDGGVRSAPAFIETRLAGLKPGGPLSQGSLDESATALLSTGVYRQIKIQPKSGPVDAAGVVNDDVEVTLREVPTQHVDFSVGYGSYERFRGGVTYVDEHFRGRGQRLTAGVKASTVGWEAAVALMDPYLLGAGRRANIDINYLERQEPSFAHQEASTGVSISHRYKPGFDTVSWENRLGYRFASSTDYNVQAVQDGSSADSSYTTSTIRAELRRDSRRPRVIDPDAGTFSRIGVGWSAPPLGATVDYVELSGEWSGAWSPAPWLVGAIRGASTTRQPGVVTELPIGERLFMGGSDTVRSFTQDDLGPRADNREPLGGLTNAVFNAELRWRLLADWREFEVATFYDIGTVDPDPWSLSAAWGQGVGAGLRYRTPVGPIRLDSAFNPDDTLGARQRWAINLTVGFAF